jgi:hypothetical protein
MARYTSLFTIEVPFEHLRQLLTDILTSCNLDVIYDTGDYLMAREVPGGVSFAKLVTVEVLIDRPLQTNNHCRQIFDLVNQAIANNRQWHLVESAAS